MRDATGDWPAPGRQGLYQDAENQRIGESGGKAFSSGDNFLLPWLEVLLGMVPSGSV
jgi:hypothetical protein